MGSSNGIWTAVSGGMAQSQNLDIISNNIANSNTTGFKRDSAVFKQYLTALERPEVAGVDIPRTPFRDSDFYHHDGRDNVMVNLDRVHTDHAQGNFKATNGPFDLAIDGPGFFAVQTPSGFGYTRAGDFKVNAQGILVTNDGFPVLGLSQQAQADAAAASAAAGVAAAPGRGPANFNPFSEAARAAGAAPLLAPINLGDAIQAGHKILVTPEGKVYAGDEQVASVAVAEFANAQSLKKEASTLYKNPDPANVPTIANQSRVRQGFLEASNVNPVSELVELIKANRMYESNIRGIKAYNDMAGKEANEVGKL